MNLQISRHGNNVFINGLPGRIDSVHANARGVNMKVSGEYGRLHITANVDNHDVIVKLHDGSQEIQAWTVQGGNGSITLDF